MKIKLLNKIALQEFIESDQFKTMPVIPISTHRAISHINNPANTPEDILLLLAFIDNEMVGYLGVLADNVQLSINTTLHCGWMSCIWVSEQHRGKKIAQQLLEASFKAWNNKLIATEFTPHAKALYDKTNHFSDFITLTGVRLYVRSDLEYILSKKSDWLKKFKPIFSIADSAINFFNDIRYKNIPALPKNYQVTFETKITEAAAAFINTQNQRYLFRRNANSLQWILRYPWVIKEWTNDDETSRYYFSTTDKSFDFIPVEVKNSDGDMCAFLLFAKRANNLTLPYCFFTCNADIVVSIIQHYIKISGVNIFTVYHTPIAEKLKQQTMQVLWKKKMQRSYLISKVLLQHLQSKELLLQDGDGDCAFT